MRRAVLAMILLIAAAPAFSAASTADLHLRTRLLLREIREQASAPTKDIARLRAELSALKAENSAAPDDKISAHLTEAEADLALVDAGSELPPPSPDEAISDSDLRDAVAQPAAPWRAPVFQNAVPAAAGLPESGGRVFDGSDGHGGLASPSTGVPPEAPTANLDQYLGLDETKDQFDFLTTASAGLLEKLKEPDDSGARASILAWKLHDAIEKHPKRGDFISVHVRVPEDGLLHLVYRLKDGGAVDEILGPLADWSNPPHGKIKPGGSGKKKKKKKSKGKSGGDDDSSSNSGKKSSGGHKGHGGGAGGGDGGGGDDGGSGAGPGGSGSSHHAKAPKIKAGGSMFDGGDGSGGDVAGPAGAHHGHGHKGQVAGGAGGKSGRGAASASGDAGDDDASFHGSGRAHARAGKSISGDDDGDASGSRGATVPLPKDFRSHGGGSPLDAEGGGGHGSKGEGNGTFERGGMGPLGHKSFDRGVPPPAVTGRAAQSPAAPAQNNPPVVTAPSPAAAAPGASALNAPFTADGDLRDAVAAHSAPSPVPAVSRIASAPAPASPDSSPRPGDWPLAAACAAAIGIGAYALLKSRQA